MPDTALPHWDMTPFFPGLDSPEFEAAFQKAIADIDSLTGFLDANDIDRRADPAVATADVALLEELIDRFNAVYEQRRLIGSYIHAFVSTNTRDTRAQARNSEALQQWVRITPLSTRLTLWVGSLDVESAIAQSTVAADYAYLLRRMQIEATHRMSSAEESLVAELEPTGATAWGKMRSDITSQIVVPIELGGERKELPMTEVNNLARSSDRDVRRTAYEAELAAWERGTLPLAASINSVKGQAVVLARKRHWDSVLDEKVFGSRIDRETLDAMMTAARESFPNFRRYLRAKARALGLTQLAWYDLFAPMGEEEKVWTWDEAERFIVDTFGAYSTKLGDFAARSFRERWTDAEPRGGKVGGGFCMGVEGDQSRILVNFEPSFNSVSTVAHELGHAYHNFVMAAQPPLKSGVPMTLAETASIFCETIIRHAGLDGASTAEQIAILDASLGGSTQVVVDITSRFLFEQGLLEGRAKRELSIAELNALMLDAQAETYGDAIDPALRHPYMWAYKPHYYHSTFYNYPYMFGLLFGLGLYARYQESPDTFRDQYDALLEATGIADAAELGARFDIDIRTPDFWRASLDIIRADVDRFEQLISQRL